MRILLIAYDFPPLASPQAIRWCYLTRELVRLGVEVHVLAPELVATECSLDVPPGVIVHRCDAGGLAGWLARRRRQTPLPTTGDGELQRAGHVGSVGTTLNWKGRVHKRLDAMIGLWCYPDSRGQWRRSAYAALQRVLTEVGPEVIISSHEPAVSLELGLKVAGDAKAWLADMGDPVLAPYTPMRWRHHARHLEARVCEVASAISVTTEATCNLLTARHGVPPDKIFVLRQGYDDRAPRNAWVPRLKALEDGADVHLLYTGRFYPFRDPSALLEAVVQQSRVRLSIVAPEIKDEYRQIAARSDGRITLLGEQPHRRVLELQSQCDVLVNIGNALAAQTPGKLFEYLGSGKPILHCYSVDTDPANALIEAWGRGWVCRNDFASLQRFFTTLVRSPQAICATLSGDDRSIAEYGWSNLARQLLQHCERAIQRTQTGDRP